MKSFGAFIRVVMVSVVMGPFAGAATPNSSAGHLTAPTYYIAASAKLVDSDEVYLRGDSSLPMGAVLDVIVYQYMGQGSERISDRIATSVDEDGFFTARLHPMAGKHFADNYVCYISFGPQGDPEQPKSVIQAVGRHGERLGFPKNPQVTVASGNNYGLADVVHIP